jgi:hypothetical protein
MKTPFESVENVSQPMELWKDHSSRLGGASVELGPVLYDEGCAYVFYKIIITPSESDAYSLYTITGEYNIVVVK